MNVDILEGDGGWKIWLVVDKGKSGLKYKGLVTSKYEPICVK
jgi:hypothetical protein